MTFFVVSPAAQARPDDDDQKFSLCLLDFFSLKSSLKTKGQNSSYAFLSYSSALIVIKHRLKQIYNAVYCLNQKAQFV
jgi:hypothetical protein